MTRPGERYAHALHVYRETSGLAWASVLQHLGEIDQRLVGHIRAHGGATSDECQQALGLSHQTASAQISHMTAAGLVVDSGHRRKTRSGRAAIVWALPVVPARERQGVLFV